MKNYLGPADRIDIVAPAALASGAGVLVGAMFGVTVGPAANGERVPVQVTGLVSLPKAASITPAPGALLYWDDTAKAVTTTASGNTKIGVHGSPVAAAAGDATILVRLNGAF